MLHLGWVPCCAGNIFYFMVIDVKTSKVGNEPTPQHMVHDTCRKICYLITTARQ